MAAKPVHDWLAQVLGKGGVVEQCMGLLKEVRESEETAAEREEKSRERESKRKLRLRRRKGGNS